MSDSINQDKREFLIRLLAAGALSMAPHAYADLLGKRPRKLPEGQSIYHMNGHVLVNGKVASLDTIINPKDSISTGSNGQIIFVVGKDAFILRENSELYLSSDDGVLVGGLRLLTGALLSVFGKSSHHITTSTSTIGIRGTGVYAESHYDRSYVCTCYGTTTIASLVNPEITETIVSQHHDAPRYVDVDGNITAAPFINHTDEELMLIETLVGRTTPFALFDDNYSGPKRY